MKSTRGILLVCCILLLAGCTDYEEKTSKVLDNNKRVDTVLNNYDLTKIQAVSVADAVVESLGSSDASKLDAYEIFDDNYELKQFLQIELNEIMVDVDEFVATENVVMEAENENELSQPFTPYTSTELFEDGLEVHYFLDDKTGKVEQLFLFRLPRGNLFGFSIFWIGGLVIDTAVFRG